MERMLRTRLITGVVLVVVFGAGVLLGFAADRSVVAAPAPDVASADSTAQDAEQPRRRPLYEQVRPTDAQNIQIDSIVHDYQEAMKALHAEFRKAYNPRYQALVEDTRTAIKGVLTPEQAQAYDSILVAYEQRRAERAAAARENRQ